MRATLNTVSKYKIWLICLVTVVVVPFVKPSFVGANNVESLMRSMLAYGVTALGLTISLITGEINIAIGSIVAFSSVVFAKYTETLGCIPAALITLGLCALLGFFDGYLVAYKKLPALLIAISFLISVRGLALWVSHSQPIKITNEAFIALSKAKIGPVPILFLFFLAFVAIIQVVLKYTRVGRNLYACGGNAEAAQAAGINVKRYKMCALAFSSFMAGMGGIFLTARLFSATPSVGEDAVMTIMPIIVIGGTSLKGGRGSAVSTLSGCLIMYLIFNVMSLFNVNVNLQDIVKGLILLTIVMVDKYFVNKDKKV